MHEAEVARDEEREWDLAGVEPRQVQAGPEHARVTRVVDRAAAQHADLDLRVEQHQVHRALRGGQRRVVLGVEVARVAQLEQARRPAG